MTTIFIDTETTGLSHQHDEVLEISIINENGDILLNTLVQPIRKKSWPEAEAIHGITPTMIKEQSNGYTLKDHAPNIAKLINEASAVVIYNEGYDRPFIESAIAESGSTLNPNTNWHCAMQEYAEKIGDWNDYQNNYRWHKLIDAARNVGHEWKGSAHRALADCQATLSVWKWLRDQDEKPERTELFDISKRTTPDPYGFFDHPDIPYTNEDTNMDAVLLMMGFETSFELIDCSYEALYSDTEQRDYIGIINVSVPEVLSNKARLVSAFDTEDGPCAMYVKKIGRSAIKNKLGIMLTRTAANSIPMRLKGAHPAAQIKWWSPSACSDSAIKELLKQASHNEDWDAVTAYATMLSLRRTYHPFIKHSFDDSFDDSTKF